MMTDDQINQIMPIVVATPTRTEYVTRNVHIHRAPTDESVRLLKEMEDAAEKKIIESVHVKSNAFECVVHVMYDVLSDDKIYRAVFSLNGKKMTVEHRHSARDPDDRSAAIDGLVNEVAKVIARDAIAEAFTKLDAALRARGR